MRKIIRFLIALSVPAAVIAENPAINVMSFNIRMDTPADGDNQWTYRKDLAANVIRFYETDIFGAQEVLHHQLTDLLERLPGFDYVGVGREDGKEKGEYSPVFYNKNKYAVVKSGNFWLSEDINAVGKKGWDAACERIATWAIFQEKASGKRFFFLNTHLDHVGKTARRESALLILKQVSALSESLPAIVTGDFNAAPEDEPVRVLTNTGDPRHLTDTYPISPLRYGPEWTFHNYGRAKERKRIDYIFIKGNFTVKRTGTLAETLNHLYPSDHCPIICTLVIE
jgi:endonuclease/exonuclease/phosphatase family metal-dependent hydrolase